MKLPKTLVYSGLILVSILFSGLVFGQNVFLTPQKIKNPFQTHLLLSSYTDLVNFERNLSKLEHIEVVKVDGSVDIAKAAFLCSKLNFLQEVQLHQYQGIIENDELQYLEWVPQVSIYIPKNRVDATVLNEAWNLLSKVSLRFEEVPDNFEFLMGWKQLRSLSVLGNYGKEEAHALIKIVAEHLPRLKHLELSLLGVNELPPSIKKCTQLHSLRIIDGSDWAQGRVIDDLGELVTPLRVGSKMVKVGKGRTSMEVEKNIYMPLKWISSRPTLNSKEIAHLKSLFPDVEESEALTWLEDTEEEIDFAQFEELRPYALKPKLDKQVFLTEFTEGVHAFTANTASDQVFIGDNAWSVLIPKESLQTNDLKPYHGIYHVTVQYLNNTEQLLAAGMNMSYDSVRLNYQLNPAFAIKVKVYSEDRKTELSLKSNYRSEIHFVNATNEQDRFYAWNEKSQKWLHYYDYDYQFEELEKPAKVDFYQFYGGQQTGNIQGENKSWTLEEAFETEGFNYLMPPDQFELKLGKFKNQFVLNPAGNAKEIRRIVRGNTQIGIKLMPRNRKTAPGIQEFLLFDKTHSLFPEINAFEGIHLGFKTQMTFEQVAAFFKERNWIDARLRRQNDRYFMELKSFRQIWNFELANYGEIHLNLAPGEKEKAEQQMFKRFEQYQKIRENKKILWNQLSKNSESKELEIQKNRVLGTQSNAAQKRGRMVVQSFGTFCMAHPEVVNTTNVEFILCELGKIPLDLKRVGIAYEGTPFTTLFPSIPSTKQIPVSTQNLKYLMAENKKGELYYITGDAIKSLNIQENTLSYIELKPLKNNPRISSDWLKEMGIRQNKRRKK